MTLVDAAALSARAGSRRTAVCFGLAGALLSAWLWSTAGSVRAQAPNTGTRPYRLPPDPLAVILRWDSLSGMGLETSQPALLVQASGDFSARPHPGNAVRRTGRLESAELQGLLAEVLEQHRFASISAEAVLAQIHEISQRTGRLFKTMDGGETCIEIDLPQVQHRVLFPALHAAQGLFPEVEALRHLHAIQQRLLSLANRAR